MTSIAESEENYAAGLFKIDSASRKKFKAGQALDALDIRRVSLPTVGTVKEMYGREEQVQALGPRFDALLQDRRTLDAIENDKVQIPATHDREGYCGDDHL